jgi:hypothetical protein
MPAGATPAYRGYRLQALYTLWRVLAAEDPRAEFQPEGREDLAFFDGPDDVPAELVQVKAYADPLTLSVFDPSKPHSYFHRVATQLATDPDCVASIASFGEVGQEMQGAWGDDPDLRAAVVAKLRDHGVQNADAVVDAIRLEDVSEAELRDEVDKRLRDMVTGIDPARAFDLLTYWMYECAEGRTRITTRGLVERILGIGQFLAGRQAFHREWGMSIHAVVDSEIADDDREKLASEFYMGVPANYLHVLADLDVSRDAKVAALQSGFRSARVVVIHGASGQGKTTLAYRYLSGACPEACRFRISAVRDRGSAASIASAIGSHTHALGAPSLVFLDVNPHDEAWPELVRLLVSHTGVRVLVSVREEDLARADLSGTPSAVEKIGLSLDEDEARRIYDGLVARLPLNQYLGFDDAWAAFGGGGPLLEFVHLVTQGQALADRLQGQVQSIEDRVRAGKWERDELLLLQLVSVASAFGARLRVSVVDALNLAVAARSLDLLADEYLIQIDDGANLIDGVHPIRSGMLVDVFTRGNAIPWQSLAEKALPYIHGPDIERFLKFAFSERPEDADGVLVALQQLSLDEWDGIAGVLRAVMWRGVQRYVNANRPLLDEVYAESGSGWVAVLNFDVADAMGGEATGLVDDLVTPEQREVFQALRRRQTDPKAIFLDARRWLENSAARLPPPVASSCWAAIGEVMFWIGQLGTTRPPWAHVERWGLVDALNAAPIETLADLMTGLHSAYDTEATTWRQLHYDDLGRRFRVDTDSPVLQVHDQALTAHYLVPPVHGSGETQTEGVTTEDDPLNHEAALRVDLLRRLFPDRDVYAVKGYGHGLGAYDLPFDPTTKTCERQSLPVRWSVDVNAVFGGLAVLPHRPAAWRQYAEATLSLRRSVLASLAELTQEVRRHFQSRQALGLLELPDALSRWKKALVALSNPPALPQHVVGALGATEHAVHRAMPARLAQTRDRLGGYLAASATFTRSMHNFFMQAPHAVRSCPMLRRASFEGWQTSAATSFLESEGVDFASAALSLHNLTEAYTSLPALHEMGGGLFQALMTARDIDQMQARERRVYRDLHAMWHFFVNAPDDVMSNPLRDTKVSLEQARTEARERLTTRLDSGLESDMRARIVSDRVRWDGSSCLWIALDVNEWLDAYGGLGAVLEVVRGVLTDGTRSSALDHALVGHWEYIAVVPMVRGRALWATAWRIHRPVVALRQQGKTALWDHVFHDIDDACWAELGLETWVGAHIHAATELLDAMGPLYKLVSAAADLVSLPAGDERTHGILSEYAGALMAPMTEAAQRVLDANAAIYGMVTEIAGNRPKRPTDVSDLATAVSALRAAVVPDPDHDGRWSSALGELPEWQTDLENALHLAIAVCSGVVSLVLDEPVPPAV